MCAKMERTLMFNHYPFGERISAMIFFFRHKVDDVMAITRKMYKNRFVCSLAESKAIK